jgi:Zn-dependent protease
MISILTWLAAFMVAITIHETAHAWMADRLGDPTPKLMGRLSLNPLVHYDPIGTTLLLTLVVMRALGIPVIPFGWAKPVRFDPYNLKNPRRDAALISFAGPFSNLALATILGIILRLLLNPFSPFIPLLSGLFLPFIVLNVVLALFNLVPVHPLDGGKILIGLLPPAKAYEVDIFLKQYGMIILLFLIFPFGGTSPIFLILGPALKFILKILIPGNPIA